MKMHKPIMFVGTCSDAGKSVLNAGFCRILKQDGCLPAPFKAQNMSLNSFATPDGYEIGRAQAVQAEACGIACHTDMNPVLLKPSGEMMSQVILNGKPVGNRSAYEYFRKDDNVRLFDEAYAAFCRLSERYSPIVMEGAGSISELNLKKRDIVNMRMAARAGADVYLVADIERGGVFGSVYGSVMLLNEEERALLKGIIINKFRGDVRLFDEGRQIIEDLTGIPVVGVVPYLKDIYIEDEDSVALETRNNIPAEGKVNVVVVKLPQMSNFTDFNALQFDKRINVYYSTELSQIEKADIVILPGSKSTIKDLLYIREKGIPALLKQMQQANKTIIGICGGYQMLGERIDDPHNIEGVVSTIEGIGLLPMTTVITSHKKTVQQQFTFLDGRGICAGYEIHMGESTIHDDVRSLVTTNDGHTDGIYLNDYCWGTYMHGILDNQEVIDRLVAPYTNEPGALFSYNEFKENEYDRLAAHLRQHINIKTIYDNAGILNQ
ncbi:cobyric acid synthase [Carboxylicivirga mesophila]|uniref:Cobyric acid synthase n=1 Tax=Carboxylicivirga mesophila TaxID=1166478 RepID=A0ABS5KD81_9BACT|nr:cobyric acid synthase [Carboxylicivirga mesophila]MBS2212968.1 cobyric acid synthase [Carboxylicivirga mesophila]